VYALGCLLYACLTGTAPFHRQSAAATILAHIEDSPPRPSDTSGVPRAFDAVLVRAVAKQPADRYATAGELGAAAVEAAKGGDGAPSPRVVRGRDEPAPTAVMPGTEREVTGVTARLRFYSDRRRGRVMLGVLAVLVAIAVAGALAAVLSSSKKTPTGPLTSAEVMGAVRAFASAYSDRDPRALARALAPDVERVSPTAVEHGRAAVLAEYEQQFGSEPIRAYELADAQILAGPVGRVSGSYTVVLRGRAAITGTVAFGVERVGGRAEIGLIATQ
jgi:hypothetical protein